MVTRVQSPPQADPPLVDTPPDDLAADAAAIDAGRVPTGAPPPAVDQAEAGPDLRAEAREAVQLAGAVLGPALSLFELGARLAACYGQAEADRITDALGNWCEARGVSVSVWFGRWAPEIMLGAAVIAPAVPVLAALAKERAEKADQAAGDQAAAPMVRMPTDMTGSGDGGA